MKPKFAENYIFEHLAERNMSVDPDGGVWRTYRGETYRAELVLPAGYLAVHLYAGKDVHRALAHRLVWRYFHGPIPGELTINHKNGIKADNRPDNLELMTMSEQRLHRYHVLHLPPAHGEAHGGAKLTEEAVKQIRQCDGKEITVCALAKLYGCDRATVYDTFARRTWRHVA